MSPPTESHPNRDERKRKRSKGKRRNKSKSKSTTAFNPEHTFLTSGYTSTHSTTDDPCTTTHLGYCIHGYCKYIEGLSEPVCMWVQHQSKSLTRFSTFCIRHQVLNLFQFTLWVQCLMSCLDTGWFICSGHFSLCRCMKGYDGGRCGTQTLTVKNTQPGQINHTELVQTVLVVIAVVLSVISCTAILLLTCAQWVCKSRAVACTHYYTYFEFEAALNAFSVSVYGWEASEGSWGKTGEKWQSDEVKRCQQRLYVYRSGGLNHDLQKKTSGKSEKRKYMEPQNRLNKRFSDKSKIWHQ